MGAPANGRWSSGGAPEEIVPALLPTPLGLRIRSFRGPERAAEKGRFQSFLLMSLIFFVADEEDRQRPQTRRRNGATTMNHKIAAPVPEAITQLQQSGGKGFEEGNPSPESPEELAVL
jgi:hypothetical protein